MIPFIMQLVLQTSSQALSGINLILLLFSRSVVSNSLRLHGLQHTSLPCPSLSPGICSDSCLLSWWCHPTISSSVSPFSYFPQSFPASGSFLMSCLSWPKLWSFSFSISPFNEYSGLISFRVDWFDLLAVQGMLKHLLSTTVWKHQFFGAKPSL